MAKKKKTKECPSYFGWLISFGDLMTLLLTFFILLYSMSAPQVREAMKLLSHFSGEPNNKPFRVSILPPIVPISTDVAKKIRKKLEKILPPHAFELAVNKRYVMIRLFNDILFLEESAKLTPDAKAGLDKISQVIKEIRNVFQPKEGKFSIRVEGHTNKDTKSNPWELSIKRAENVAFYMMSRGVDPSLFFIAGYGTTKPLYKWNNPLLLRRNDRVEIYIDIEKNISKKVNVTKEVNQTKQQNQ
jgi:chemotaxis protein MotB